MTQHQESPHVTNTDFTIIRLGVKDITSRESRISLMGIAARGPGHFGSVLRAATHWTNFTNETRVHAVEELLFSLDELRVRLSRGEVKASEIGPSVVGFALARLSNHMHEGRDYFLTDPTMFEKRAKMVRSFLFRVAFNGGSTSVIRTAARIATERLEDALPIFDLLISICPNVRSPSVIVRSLIEHMAENQSDLDFFLPIIIEVGHHDLQGIVDNLFGWYPHTDGPHERRYIEDVLFALTKPDVFGSRVLELVQKDKLRGEKKGQLFSHLLDACGGLSVAYAGPELSRSRSRRSPRSLIRTSRLLRTRGR